MSYNVFGFHGAITFGNLYDQKGNTGFFVETPAPGGIIVNTKGNFGFNITYNTLASNAPTITDMSGLFANQHLGVADGLAVDMTTFEGRAANGSVVTGGQLSFGFGEGVNFGATRTNTTVFGTATLPPSYWSDPGSWEAYGR
jgi:hypothetical protein